VLKVHEKRIKRTTSLPVDMLLSLKAVTGRMDSTVFDRLRKIGKVKKTEKRDAGIVWEAGGIRFTTWESYNDTPPRGPDIDAILNVSRYDMEGTVLECGKVIKKVEAAKEISDAVWFEVVERREGEHRPEEEAGSEVSAGGPLRVQRRRRRDHHRSRQPRE